MLRLDRLEASSRFSLIWSKNHHGPILSVSTAPACKVLPNVPGRPLFACGGAAGRVMSVAEAHSNNCSNVSFAPRPMTTPQARSKSGQEGLSVNAPVRTRRRFYRSAPGPPPQQHHHQLQEQERQRQSIGHTFVDSTPRQCVDGHDGSSGTQVSSNHATPPCSATAGPQATRVMQSMRRRRSFKSPQLGEASIQPSKACTPEASLLPFPPQHRFASFSAFIFESDVQPSAALSSSPIPQLRTQQPSMASATPPRSPPAPRAHGDAMVWVCIRQEIPHVDCPASAYIMSKLDFMVTPATHPLQQQRQQRQRPPPHQQLPQVEPSDTDSTERLLDEWAATNQPAFTLTGHTFQQCSSRLGPWSCYMLAVTEGCFGPDPNDVMFPNCLVLEDDGPAQQVEAAPSGERPAAGAAGTTAESAGRVLLRGPPLWLASSAAAAWPGRSLRNVGSMQFLCEWLADPTEQKLKAHLNNLATKHVRMDAFAAAAEAVPVFASGVAGKQRGGGSTLQLSSANLPEPEGLQARAYLAASGDGVGLDGREAERSAGGSLGRNGRSTAAAAEFSKKRRGGMPRQVSWPACDWCYGRLMRTWGSRAMKQLGFTKRHVLVLFGEIQDEWRALNASTVGQAQPQASKSEGHSGV